MMNIIFTNSTRYAIVEVMGTKLWDVVEERSWWTPLGALYYVSHPHKADDGEIQKIIEKHESVVDKDYEAGIVKEADLFVNITRLRSVLQIAAKDVCDCASI